MKKGLTEIVFILDRSGSMGGLENDTIGGFNSMIDKQREEDGEAIITTVLFDDKMKMVHDRVPISNIKKMTRKDYYVQGCTALLDALGKTIKYINTKQKEMPDDERPEKTMFIITTDGAENSSREFDFATIKKMVTKKQNKKNWEFLFIGANIDAIGAASSIGIKANRSVNYIADAKGTAVTYACLSKAVSQMRTAPSVECVDAMLEGWNESIKADEASRKKKAFGLKRAK